MIYIKSIAYLIVIGMMAFFWEQSTKYCSDYHLCFKGMAFATLTHYFINKAAVFLFEDFIYFYYLPCIILSALLALYFQWDHFNSKWSGADKVYHGKFSTIQSLINASAVYEAQYTNFYIVKKREDKWYFDKKIQITLSFPDYIRYYIFLVQKQKQDYRKRKAESDLAAANEIKDILTEYVGKNEKEANKYFDQSKEILQQIKSGQGLKPLDTTFLGAEKTDWHYAVVEIYNPDGNNSKNQYKYFPDYDSAVSYLKHRMEDEKINLYIQGNKASEIHITDNIWDLTAHGTWGKITMYRWAILKVKK